MKTIPLTRGIVALVDDGDYEHLVQWKWYACVGRKSWYAKRKIYIGGDGYKEQGVSMHRQILGLQFGDKREVDHIDGDGLNNTRANLRLCSSSQNKMNIGRRTDNKAGFKGVSWHNVMNKWRARIKINGKEIRLGYFNTPVEAAEVYRHNASKYHGEFARLD